MRCRFLRKAETGTSNRFRQLERVRERTIAIYKRGDTYWYEFQFNGERIQASAQTSNKDAARQIEAAHRVRLAKGEAGIIERPPAPTLADFGPRFERAIVTLCADKPATVGFYREKLRRLLEDRDLAGARLNVNR
jgi:hypothetical protein